MKTDKRCWMVRGAVSDTQYERLKKESKPHSWYSKNFQINVVCSTMDEAIDLAEEKYPGCVLHAVNCGDYIAAIKL